MRPLAVPTWVWVGALAVLAVFTVVAQPARVLARCVSHPLVDWCRE